MSADVILAALAAACGVYAVWEALQLVDPPAVGRRLHGVVAPIVRAGQTGRAPTSPERLRLTALAALVLLAAGWVVAGPAVGVLLAILAPWAITTATRWRRARWRARLAEGAAAVARGLADALGAGHSIRGAFTEAGARAGVPGPAGDELRAAGAALVVGRRTDDVLRQWARRASDPAYDTIVAAVLLQRDAGGDLARLLREVAGALEQSARARADARAATAQARFTAWLVAGLPVVALALAELASPGYLLDLLAEPIPALMVGAAIGLELLAVVLVRRVVVTPR
ncbi:MAG: type II secretion system F family protein [Solirubrobacteraceae bacterium]|nr:type II secretion system F family protein [Solirubrobacteraceae bacterium]